MDQPACLVAHNGENFDFPVLLEAIKRVNSNIEGKLWCLDSLLFFKAFPNIFGKQNSVEVEQTTVCSTTKGGKEDNNICAVRRRLDFTDDKPTVLTVPRKQTVSYSLQNVYKRVFGRTFPNAHNAETDCVAMIQLFHKCLHLCDVDITKHSKPFQQ